LPRNPGRTEKTRFSGRPFLVPKPQAGSSSLPWGANEKPLKIQRFQRFFISFIFLKMCLSIALIRPNLTCRWLPFWLPFFKADRKTADLSVFCAVLDKLSADGVFVRQRGDFRANSGK
jgi:hypothetical protein